MMGCIERVYHPGCKFDYMLCLIGGQGAGSDTDTASTETTSIESSDSGEVTYWDVSYTFQEGGTENSAKWVFCPDGTSEDSVAGKRFVYEGESFSGLEDDPFTIFFDEDGTYNYSESLLSSYIGFGEWSVTGDVLTLAENVEATENPSIQYFRIEDDNIIYLGTFSSNFPLTHVEDGASFTCS